MLRRVPRPKQRTPDLRDRLLDVAVDVLDREGVVGFTTRAIAREADTSPPAVYELFGDKGGLLRAVFFEGFRRLGEHLAAVGPTDDPRADLERLVGDYRGFMRENPTLSAVMFSRPFTDFAPGPDDLRAGAAVRDLIVTRVQRCIDAGELAGDATDAAHVLIALTQGLAGAENARRLGTSRASVDRRWELGVRAVLDGMAVRS